MSSGINSIEDERRLRWRRIAIITVVAVVLLAGGLVVGKPLYRAFKGWRAKQLAAQAERLFADNDWTRGTEKARAALLLKPTEPAALRAMARAFTHATNASALQLWQQLSIAGQASPQDRRSFVELAVRLGALGPAAVEVRRLLAEGPNDHANLWLASQVCAALGDYSQTLHYATRARLHDPANTRYQLFLSSLLFDSPEGDERSAARTNLWALARDPGAQGLEALGFLARRHDLSADQRRELIALLKQHPLSATSQQLLILDQRVRLEPDRRPAILDEAIAQYKETNPEVLGDFAVWLNQNEEFQRTLLALPLEKALQRKDLFIPHLDALASLGRWQELDRILASRTTPLEKVHFEGFSARCAMQLSNTTSASLHWKRALASAERRPQELHWLAVYAERCGELETAKKAYRLLIACVANVRPPYQALLQLTLKSGTTGELCDLLGEMVRRWPDDPALRNDSAYLNLLLGKELAASHQTAGELVQQFPDSLPYRTTLALAWYRLNDPAAAARVFAGRTYDWRLALPGNRAVHAAVLAASGDPEGARAQARAIPQERLRPEELELIHSLR